eukprot:TRINITY_DN5750_c1_g1_i1.p1 TRINITY_DN5750_c1_g1~~TRINITY_DN5750_c1_g1_i1.p1  ORF type:complete len:282 (+),score=27.12 TRINITY_DN5750_c1_g1_i1:131-976(+)
MYHLILLRQIQTYSDNIAQTLLKQTPFLKQPNFYQNIIFQSSKAPKSKKDIQFKNKFRNIAEQNQENTITKSTINTIQKNLIQQDLRNTNFGNIAQKSIMGNAVTKPNNFLKGATRWQKIVREAEAVFKAAFFLHVFIIYIAELTICVGPSMMPTFGTRMLAVVDHTSMWFGEIKVGDVILAWAPDNPRKLICKRVLGLGGDVINVPPAHFLGEYQRVRIPPGRMWLQGDNFTNSTDSREYGPVPQALVCGKVIYKLWPLGAIGPVTSHVPDHIKEAYQLT